MKEFFSRLWSAEMERLELLVDYWYVWLLFILFSIGFIFLTSIRKK